MSTLFEKYKSDKVIAVAVSGGPDSMALLHMLSAKEIAPRIVALTVDHGLRDNSADEAAQVGAWVKDWPHVEHHILRWDGAKPKTKILEEARRARYALMADFCRDHGAASLFLGHHMDDQAETFLLRLSAGSGLDGLAAMQPEQPYSLFTSSPRDLIAGSMQNSNHSMDPAVKPRDDVESSLILMRPLLNKTKNDLVAYCQTHRISFVEDPTNVKTDFARPRLRAARNVLEEEGLSAKRLSVTAARLSRARSALEQMTEDVFQTHCRSEKDAISMDWPHVKIQPEEILIRIVLKSMTLIGPERAYAPRLEKVEDLVSRLLHDPAFNGATLGGCKFAWRDGGEILYIDKE